jgi:hypothetical protein
LHEGRSFEPTGVYRLPMGLEQFPNKTARLERAKEVHEQGLYGRLEYEWMLQVIEEVGDARPDDRPGSSAQGPD